MEIPTFSGEQEDAPVNQNLTADNTFSDRFINVNKMPNMAYDHKSIKWNKLLE